MSGSLSPCISTFRHLLAGIVQICNGFGVCCRGNRWEGQRRGRSWRRSQLQTSLSAAALHVQRGDLPHHEAHRTLGESEKRLLGKSVGVSSTCLADSALHSVICSVSLILSSCTFFLFAQSSCCPICCCPSILQLSLQSSLLYCYHHC